jgi:hypothetical protein
MEKYCEAFVTDAPTSADLDALGFKAPDHRFELTFKDGTRRTLLLARPPSPGLPWHAKLADSPSIYSIRTDAVAELISTSPAKYRHRLVVRLPEGGAITGVKITDLSTQKTLLDIRRPAPDVSWDSVLTALPEKERPLIPQLIAQLSPLRARKYVSAAFSTDYKHQYPEAKTPEGWRYRLEVSLRLPGAKADETRVLFFTSRIGGTTQIAGAPVRGCIFEIEQPLIDALFPLTFLKDDTKDIPVIVPPPDLVPQPVPAKE